MISKLKAVLDDDRGVSPVIGVILMVAITVILAAVIGTFVLGLGDSLEQAPQSTLDAEFTDSDTIEISHNGGDAVEVGSLSIVLEGDSNSDTLDSLDDTYLSGSDSEFGVGETLTIGTNDPSTALDSTGWGETNIRVVHSPSDSIILDTTITIP